MIKQKYMTRVSRKNTLSKKLIFGLSIGAFGLVAAISVLANHQLFSQQTQPPELAKAYTTGCLPWSTAYQSGASNRDIVGETNIPAQIGTPPPTNTPNVIKGTVYEDIAANAVAGRYGFDLNAVNTNYKISGARVELYDPATTKLISTVDSASDGTFRFDATNTDFSKFSNPAYNLNDPANADCARFAGTVGKAYIVRVVLSTVKSPRGGTSAATIPVPTYAKGCSGMNHLGAWSNKYKEDFGPGTVGQPAAVANANQIFQSAMVTNCDVATYGENLSFGYSFSMTINKNDSGFGSLRQAITNINLLDSEKILPGSFNLPYEGDLSEVVSISQYLEKLQFFVGKVGQNTPFGRANFEDLGDGQGDVITLSTALPTITSKNAVLYGEGYAQALKFITLPSGIPNLLRMGKPRISYNVSGTTGQIYTPTQPLTVVSGFAPTQSAFQATYDINDTTVPPELRGTTRREGFGLAAGRNITLRGSGIGIASTGNSLQVDNINFEGFDTAIKGKNLLVSNVAIGVTGTNTNAVQKGIYSTGGALALVWSYINTTGAAITADNSDGALQSGSTQFAGAASCGGTWAYTIQKLTPGQLNNSFIDSSDGTGNCLNSITAIKLINSYLISPGALISSTKDIGVFRTYLQAPSAGVASLYAQESVLKLGSGVTLLKSSGIEKYNRTIGFTSPDADNCNISEVFGDCGPSWSMAFVGGTTTSSSSSSIASSIGSSSSTTTGANSGPYASRDLAEWSSTRPTCALVAPSTTFEIVASNDCVCRGNLVRTVKNDASGGFPGQRFCVKETLQTACLQNQVATTDGTCICPAGFQRVEVGDGISTSLCKPDTTWVNTTPASSQSSSSSITACPGNKIRTPTTGTLCVCPPNTQDLDGNNVCTAIGANSNSSSSSSTFSTSSSVSSSSSSSPSSTTIVSIPGALPISQVPNGGDGNGDNIRDDTQGGVATVPLGVNGVNVPATIVAGSGTGSVSGGTSCSTLSSVQNVSPTVTDKFRTPYQLISFSIPCPTSTTVTIYWYIPTSDVNNSFVLRKYGSSVVGGTTNSWYSYPATITRDSIGGRPVVKATYTLINNQVGDESGFDGVIVDPVTIGVDEGSSSSISIVPVVSSTPQSQITTTSRASNGTGGAVAPIVKTGGIGQIVVISALAILALIAVSYLTLKKQTQQKVDTIK